jgi:putative transposase
VWTEEHARRQKRDLSAKRYVYCWADGIHLEARLDEQAQCILVIIGATPEGQKELVGFTDGLRESSQSWRDLLLDLKRRGLTTAPQIAVAKPALAKAGGALGFWKALGEVWPTTREQRCWVHKTANILNKMPNSLHTKAKRALQQIWMAETKKDAVTALEAFVETYQVKYKKAADCLTKDRDALLAFYDFPAEHWKHLRTTNPLKAPLRPSGTAPSGQKAACRTRRRLPWSSSLPRVRRKIGAASFVSDASTDGTPAIA